jgi:hypothetical protein
MHQDGFFTEDFVEDLGGAALMAIPSISSVHDIGFVRFIGDRIDCVYLVVTFMDLHTGFIRFNLQHNVWHFDSFYYEVDKRVEYRYSPTGEFMFKYLHFRVDGEIDVIKMKDGEYKGSYQIKDADVINMPERRSLLERNGIIKKGSDQFKVFRKNGMDYIAVVNPQSVHNLGEHNGVSIDTANNVGHEDGRDCCRKDCRIRRIQGSCSSERRSRDRRR